MLRVYTARCTNRLRIHELLKNFSIIRVRASYRIIFMGKSTRTGCWAGFNALETLSSTFFLYSCHFSSLSPNLYNFCHSYSRSDFEFQLIAATTRYTRGYTREYFNRTKSSKPPRFSPLMRVHDDARRAVKIITSLSASESAHLAFGYFRNAERARGARKSFYAFPFSPF